jgi:hypothetical protein
VSVDILAKKATKTKLAQKMVKHGIKEPERTVKSGHPLIRKDFLNLDKLSTLRRTEGTRLKHSKFKMIMLAYF